MKCGGPETVCVPFARLIIPSTSLRWTTTRLLLKGDRKFGDTRNFANGVCTAGTTYFALAISKQGTILQGKTGWTFHDVIFIVLLRVAD